MCAFNYSVLEANVNRAARHLLHHCYIVHTLRCRLGLLVAILSPAPLPPPPREASRNTTDEDTAPTSGPGGRMGARRGRPMTARNTPHPSLSYRGGTSSQKRSSHVVAVPTWPLISNAPSIPRDTRPGHQSDVLLAADAPHVAAAQVQRGLSRLSCDETIVSTMVSALL